MLRRLSSIAATLALALALVSIGTRQSVRAYAGSSNTIKVDGGQISGTTTDGVHSFKGIPFAAPPVGSLRWKAPQPVVPWNGVRSADTFGAQCMQKPYPAGSPYATAAQPTSEDCL